MTFTPDVYAEIRAGAQASARVLAPLLRALFHPASVTDVGCGEGWFAGAFAELGCRAVGVERESPDVRPPGVEFVERDLNWHRLDDLGGFDLAVCLEVAEHLSEAAAPALVDDLVSLAPVVAFSAAVPGQGGHGHVNEQWPGYWARLFEERGYAVSGGLRWLVWDDERVEPWYRQNLLVAADLGAPDGAAVSGNELRGMDLFDGSEANLPLPVVHPVTFSHHVGLRLDAERRLGL